MRRRPSSIWRLLVLAALLPSAALGQDGAAGSGAAFLLVPIGARATALGQAGVAETGASEATFWNPAGLAGLQSTEFGVQYASTFASRNTALSLIFVNQELGSFGVSAYLVDYGSQDIVPPGGGLPSGRIAPKNLQLFASYATDIGRVLALGVSYKLIQFRQDCQGTCGPIGDASGTTHAVDVGTQLTLGPDGAVRIGAAVQHIGFALQVENRDQADPLPTRLVLGASYKLPLQLLGTDPAVAARINVDVQDQWNEYGSPDARLGAEIAYSETLYVRGGYAFLQSETRGASFGVGVRFDRVSVDFARVFYQASAFDDPIHFGLRIAL